MLRTLPQTRASSLTVRLGAVAVMTLVTIVAARISIPMEPVPFTLQPLAMLLAGMVLGSRDGALSQLIYVGLIALNLPVDANMRGQAALFGPTGGYLVGFIVGAFVSGWLVERGTERLIWRWLAGVAGILALYLCGIPVLMLTRGLDLSAAWLAGAAPFFVPDLVKAVIAAAMTEAGRAALLRTLQPPRN